MLDGHRVGDFIAKRGQDADTVWIDSKSKALVKVEHGMFVIDNRPKRFVLPLLNLSHQRQFA